MAAYKTIEEANKIKEIYENHVRWSKYQFRTTEENGQFHMEILWTCYSCKQEFWTRQIDGGLIGCPDCAKKDREASNRGVIQHESETWEAWGDLEQQEERDA